MGYCTSCGVELRGSHFCTTCGAPVSGTSRLPPHVAGDLEATAPLSRPAGRDTASPLPGVPGAGGAVSGTRRRALPLILASAVLVAVVAAALFVRRDDERPDIAGTPTPATSASPGESPPTIRPTPSLSSSATSSPPSASDSLHTPPQATPFYVVVLASKTEAEGGKTAAKALLPQIEATGYSALVFPSGDYASLRCCYWVAAAGPFSDAVSAKAAITPLRATSSAFSTAYDRCVGTESDCPS